MSDTRRLVAALTPREGYRFYPPCPKICHLYELELDDGAHQAVA